MKTRWIITPIVIAILAAVFYGIIMFINESVKPTPSQQQATTTLPVPHFTSSSPVSGATVQANAALNFVTINFDSNLTTNSNIAVTHPDSTDATTGPLEVQNSTLRIPISVLQVGQYTVHYTACDLNNNCTQGTFVFDVKAD